MWRTTSTKYKKKITRKRIRQLYEWIDTKTKSYLNSGIKQINRKGKQISEKIELK